MVDEERTWVRRAGPLGALEADWNTRYHKHAVECFAETGAWMVAFDDFRIDDGWLYVRLPDDPPEVLEERRAAHKERARGYLEKGTDHWEALIRPEVEDRLTRMRRSKPRSTAPASIARHVERCMDEAARTMGHLHWAMAAGFDGDWAEEFAAITGKPAIEAAACMGGIDHETTRLVTRLRQLARLRAASSPEFDATFERLLQRYGRRTGQGYGAAVTFGSPTWSMEPHLALDVIDSYTGLDFDDVKRRERTARAARKRALARHRRELSQSDRERFDAAYNQAIRRVRAMEDHNHLMEQETLGLLREAMHRAGRAFVDAGRIEKPTDVLSLTLAELADPPAPDLRPLVAERKAERARRAESPPPEYIGPPPPPRPRDEPAAAPSEPGVLTGIAASPGRATGRAVVATDSQAIPSVSPGDVLVARDAGPAWTPVFPILGGLVLDTGVMFQHAALVAREFGIPAVLGARDATTRIVSGTTVVVDGTNGRVELPIA